MNARSGEGVERVTLVDALRGFALFGVIASNVVVLAGAGALGPGSAFDQQFGTWSAYLVTGKFLALFSLLFGVSFGLFLFRCEQASRSAAAPFLRRMAVLLLAGALHFAVAGVDILRTYAVLGVLLLLLRNASNRVLLIAAVLSLALPELWRAGSQAAGLQPPAPIATRAERMRLAIEGPYLDLVAIRARMLTQWWNGFLRQDTAYLALFLVGLVAVRRRLLQDPETHRRVWRTWWWGGLALTIAGYAAQSHLRPSLAGGAPWPARIFGIVWIGTVFLQGITYGAGVVLLWLRGGRARRALEALSPAGRMALTNYFSASVIVTAVVVATGSYGRLGVAPAFAAGTLLWTAQLALCAWWLRRHRAGPAEWIWRKLART